MSARNGVLQNINQRETAFFKNGPYGNELADALALSKRPSSFACFTQTHPIMRPSHKVGPFGRIIPPMKISTEKLLLVAGIVWIVAGGNIANIGIGVITHDHLVWWVLALTLAVFVLFHVFVFQKLVRKHAERIRGFEEDRKHIWHFFDRKGYIIMAIMMGGGIALRMSGVLPEWFIAFFYTGLGFALTVAGISFIISYVRGARDTQAQ